MSSKKNYLLNCVENSLSDLHKKGNLDLAWEAYNPNNFFEKVYHITYNPNDRKFKSPSKIKIICPFYFRFLHLIKNIKIILPLVIPFVFILHVLYLYTFMKKKGITIARGRMPYLMSLSLLFATKLSKIPMLVSLGGDNRLAQEKMKKYNVLNSKKLSFLIESLILNLVDGVIVPNKYTESYVKSISKQSNIFIIPLPLRKSFFDSENSALIQKKSEINYLLFVGRLIGDKHPDFVLKVFKKYIEKSEDTNTKLYIVGDGEMKSSLKKMSIKMKIHKRVIFTGFLGTDKMKEFLSKAKVCLIPVSGFMIYEAAIFGKPIITSDIEWHSEFINDGENGWVCRYLDVDHWANCLHQLMADYEKTDKIAKNLKKKIKQYKPDISYNKEINLYKKILRGKIS